MYGKVETLARLCKTKKKDLLRLLFKIIDDCELAMAQEDECDDEERADYLAGMGQQASDIYVMCQMAPHGVFGMDRCDEAIHRAAASVAAGDSLDLPE